MKLMKLFIIFFLVLSCKEETFEVSEKLTYKESLSLRLSIQSIKKIKNLVAKTDSDYRISGVIPSELCFDFKYPISVQYNNSSVLNVSSFSQFVELILSETPELHMTGIGFPFTVVMSSDNSEQVISSETSFETLIESCGYGTLTFEEIKNVYATCFDFNYPISIIINGTTYTFNSENDAVLLAAAFTQKVVSFNFIYPFSIKYTANNQNANVPDYYTFTNIIAGCN
jgi:hypothetical protein